jgi:FkbM family methyltransferase
MVYNFIIFFIEGLKRRFNRLLFSIIKKSYKKNLSPYSRYNDVLTDKWYLYHEYEEQVNNIIDIYSIEKKYKNFFIDIGANIGFTTISNHEKFDQIFCFEPNQIVYNILKTNTKLHCNTDKITLFDVGLGSSKGNYELKIPKHNFGGAFIEKNNRYDIETLLKKDGFNSYDEKDFLIENIVIEDAEFLTNNVFSELNKSSKGVIKIDVEGYEIQIIELILKNIDCHSVAIIFENLSTMKPKELGDILQNTDFEIKETYLLSGPDSPIGKILKNQYKKELKLVDYDNMKTFPEDCMDVVINLSKN